MQLLIFASILSLGVPFPAGEGYSSSTIIGGSRGILGGHGAVNSKIIPGDGGGGGYDRSCGQGEILHVDGSCIRPEVSRNVYVFAAPHLPVSYGPTPHIPGPKLRYNVVFVRTPVGPAGPEPIVVPPPQEKTLVYVLTKNGQVDQQVIEVPAGPGQSPEVFYVNYDEGDNPVLPGGLTLQEALNSAVSQSGQIVEDGGAGSGIIGGGGSGNGIISGRDGFEAGITSGSEIGGAVIGGGGGFGAGIIGGVGIGGDVIDGGGIDDGQEIGGGVISDGYSAPSH